GSVFSSGQPLIRELSARLNAAGIGYFKFNNRGHDVVAGRGKHLAGAAFEHFGQCVDDIRAMIGFAVKCGYRRFILAGHSTGANKVLHYAARTRDRRVMGLVLLGPISDIAAETRRIRGRELRRRVALAARGSLSGHSSGTRPVPAHSPASSSRERATDSRGANAPSARPFSASLGVIVCRGSRRP